jgi:hypothetical protein
VVFVTIRLSVLGHRKDEPVEGFDNDSHQQALPIRGHTLEVLSGDFCRRVLTMATLATILFCSMALNHELPSLSMPPAYKEERTEPALSRSCAVVLILKRPACCLCQAFT